MEGVASIARPRLTQQGTHRGSVAFGCSNLWESMQVL